MKKVIFVFILCFVFTSLIFTACSESGNTANETAINTNEQDGNNTTTEEVLSPEIPETDMDGKTFTILTQSWGTYTPLDFIDVAPEEMTGEPLNDAAYNRNINMASEYNCIVKQYNVGSADEAVSKLKNSVNSGDNAYEICFMRGTNFASVLTGGYLRELSELPYVNFDNPWWDAQSKEALSIKGKSYVVCGDISTNDMLAVWDICFNKGLIDDYNLDDPYVLVKNGTWTFDKSVEMSKQVANDLNGDGKMDGNDIWGINHTNDTVIGVLNACGIHITELDNNGVPQITIGSEQSISRTIDVLTKLFNEDYAMDTLSRDTMKATDMDGHFFANDQVLFLFTATHLVSQLRQMDVEFGVLPYPKYMESEDYAPSTAGIFLSLVAIPSSNIDLENTGIFMEAYAYSGYKNLIPEFYNKILQGKFIRDDSSGEILDYLYGNISYDTGNLFNFGNFTRLLCDLSATKNTDVASFFAKNESITQDAIDKLVETIK